ncbi:MAG: nucleoside monophosphate kinase, partial [bacterium]|nr:nucleoside monophosphate kinase [bacterium]
GELVDSSVTLRLLEKYFQEHQDGVVADGFPRTLHEAQELKVQIDKVFHITISDEVVKKRLQERKRFDDTPEAIEKRLQIYHEETEPVLEHYRTLNLLEEVDGERTISEIAADIVSRISK